MWRVKDRRRLLGVRLILEQLIDLVLQGGRGLRRLELNIDLAVVRSVDGCSSI